MATSETFQTEASFPPKQTPPPRKSRLRRVAVTLGVMALALGMILLFAPAIAARTGLKDTIVGMAAGSIDGKLEVGSLDLGWLAPVELRDVKLTDPDGQVVATIPLIRTEKTLWALAHAGGDYGTVTVEKPVIHVVIAGDSSNLERVLAPVLNARQKPKSATRAGVKVEVTGGEARLSHAQYSGESKFTDLTATVTVPRDAAQPITATGQFTAADTPGGAAFDVSVGEKVAATVRAHEMPLGSFAALMRRFGRGTEATGQLSGDVGATYESGATAIKGSATVNDLSAAGPWSDGHRLEVKQVAASADEVRLGHGTLSLEKASLTSDVGRVKATAKIGLAAPIENLFTTPGLDVDMNLDVAKLANAVPKLLRLKPGTSLTDGYLAASVESHSKDGRVVWTGKLNTTALRGTRDNKPIGWEKPMLVSAEGHLRESDQLPVFERLTWQADFIGLNAAGSVEHFAANANVDFDRLGQRLAEFIDLGGSSLGGRGVLAIECNPGPDGTFQLGASMRATNFRYTDVKGHQVHEPELTATLSATGKYAPQQPLRLDAAALNVAASADKLTAELAAPIPNLKTASGGKARLALDGELAHWYARAAEFVPSLVNYKLAGRGPVRATLALTPSRYELADGKAELTQFHFDGAGVTLDEPTLKLQTGMTYDRMTGAMALTDVLVHGPTALVTTPRADLTFSPTAVKTNAKVTADVGRVLMAFKLDPSPVNGLAIGTVKLEPQNGPLVFDADFRVTEFKYGNPADPTWAEPWVTVKAVGFYDGAKSELDLRAVELAREGLSVKGDAKLDDLKGAMRLDSKGVLSYDLARLQPQLKHLLGETASATGSDSRPFSVVGPLSNLDALSAQAGLSWDQLRAYGFTVDAGQLTATARGGDLRFTPIDARFGGGQLHLEPKIDLTSPGTVMTLKPGKLIEKTKLTPEVCASAIGYALPAFANAADATGEISFDLGDNRIPLAKPESGSGRGVLTVHSAEVSAGPMVEQILNTLGVEKTTMKLSGEQQVPVAFQDGRVYHDQFKIMVGKTEVVSSGSVGIDKTVNLTLEMPVPPKLVNAALAKNPLIRDSLSKQKIKVPVGGTLAKPVVDEGAMARAVEGLVRGVARDLVRDNAGKVEDKVRDKLRGELDKLLPFGRK